MNGGVSNAAVFLSAASALMEAGVAAEFSDQLAVLHVCPFSGHPVRDLLPFES